MARHKQWREQPRREDRHAHEPMRYGPGLRGGTHGYEADYWPEAVDEQARRGEWTGQGQGYVGFGPGQGFWRRGHPYGGGRGEAGRGWGDERNPDARGWGDYEREGVGPWSQYGPSGRPGEASRPDHRGRGPRGYVRSDERIREDLYDRLTEDPDLDATDIEISVKDGEVTLTGFVGIRADKRRAEDIAEAISGVKHVQNNLRVRGPQGNTAA